MTPWSTSCVSRSPLREKQIFAACSGALQELEPQQPVSYQTFMRIWKHFVPLVKVMKPGSDICATCKLLRQDVHRAVNEPQTEQAIEKLRDHMEAANKERAYYKASIAAAKDDLENPESGSTHLTMDFAQQLELPAHTRTVRPLNFKVLYRIQLFGIANEPRNEQASFLFSEQHSIGLDGKKPTDQMPSSQCCISTQNRIP